MKRMAWICGMALVAAVAALPAAPSAVQAFTCGEDCKRNNDCGVQCSYCDTPSPIFEGSCELN